MVDVGAVLIALYLCLFIVFIPVPLYIAKWIKHPSVFCKIINSVPVKKKKKNKTITQGQIMMSLGRMSQKKQVIGPDKEFCLILYKVYQIQPTEVSNM